MGRMYITVSYCGGKLSLQLSFISILINHYYHDYTADLLLSIWHFLVVDIYIMDVVVISEQP